MSDLQSSTISDTDQAQEVANTSENNFDVKTITFQQACELIRDYVPASFNPEAEATGKWFAQMLLEKRAEFCTVCSFPFIKSKRCDVCVALGCIRKHHNRKRLDISDLGDFWLGTEAIHDNLAEERVKAIHRFYDTFCSARLSAQRLIQGTMATALDHAIVTIELTDCRIAGLIKAPSYPGGPEPDFNVMAGEYID